MTDMTDSPGPPPVMRPGMSLAERQALRAAILEHKLEQARREAAETSLTTRCLGHLPHRSPTMSYDQRRAEHVKCQGESLGAGCLCEWHDDEIRKRELKQGAAGETGA